MNHTQNINAVSNFSPLGGLRGAAKGDKVIWAIVVLLVLMSLLVVYSATSSLAYKMYKGNTSVYLFKQFAFTIVGVCIIYFAHRVNYAVYSKVSLILFLLAIPLLIYTLFFGTNLNEANRWIKLPVIHMTFQTSDMAKLALFMYLSRQLSKKQNVIKDFKKGFLPVIIPIAIVCILIAPANLSTALLVGATSLLLLFIGRVSMKHILLTIGIAAIPIIILISVAVGTYKGDKNATAQNGSVVTTVKSVGRVSTWIKRVQDFIYAKNDASPYQLQQAKIAIAKGGILGKGPGNSEQRNFLPHPYSDFIYAIIIEEYGLAGAAFILFIYMIFLFRCIQIFRKCPYAFGAFLALGLSFTLVIQALANMAVNVNLFPVTGVTLPLLSMGGSSFMFTCLAIGIILSVSKNVEEEKQEQEVLAK
ncbi:MAG TPA: FtsW/RodA/SpoVE family cell cycle protein [Chitinophagaceae bacterium]|nr:FtsW/RodA/SpoVE family cell cycle protein [Chitinophagaceae bacterium]